MAQTSPSTAGRTLIRNLAFGVLRLRATPFVAPGPKDSFLVIAPHQDDETLGCGGLIATATRAGARVEVVFLTDGSMSHPGHPTVPPESIAQMRKSEALSALADLGVPQQNIRFLGRKDGGLDRLAPSARDDLIAQIRCEITRSGATSVLITSGEDGSSEHVAAYVCTREAVVSLPSPPLVVEYLVWSRWSPRLLFRQAFLSKLVHRLSFPAGEAAKARALTAYVSQSKPLAPWTKAVLPSGFIESFAGSTEYFFTR